VNTELKYIFRYVGDVPETRRLDSAKTVWFGEQGKLLLKDRMCNIKILLCNVHRRKKKKKKKMFIKIHGFDTCLKDKI